MELTKVPRDFSSRYLNDGFSGGEKKRLEILQLALQQPHTAILDETDSGLDIDALNVVAEAVNTVAKDHGMGVLIITHYQRILHLVEPQRVSILFDGADRQGGRPGARHAARGRGLRLDHGRGRRRGGLMTMPALADTAARARVPDPASGRASSTSTAPRRRRSRAS